MEHCWQALCIAACALSAPLWNCILVPAALEAQMKLGWRRKEQRPEVPDKVRASTLSGFRWTIALTTLNSFGLIAIGTVRPEVCKEEYVGFLGFFGGSNICFYPVPTAQARRLCVPCANGRSTPRAARRAPCHARAESAPKGRSAHASCGAHSYTPQAKPGHSITAVPSALKEQQRPEPAPAQALQK